MIVLRRMALCRVREVKFLHGILHGISTATGKGVSEEPGIELLADKSKEAAAACLLPVSEGQIRVAFEGLLVAVE